MGRIVASGAEALVVALGVDTYEHDPLGTFSLQRHDFSQAATAIGACALPTVVVQEGGYAVDHIGANVATFLSAWP